MHKPRDIDFSDIPESAVFELNWSFLEKVVIKVLVLLEIKYSNCWIKISKILDQEFDGVRPLDSEGFVVE